MLAIETKALCKTYTRTAPAEGNAGFWRRLFHRQRSQIDALREVSFTVEQGEILGLLGSNGAGKTTLIKCLTGILAAETGQVSVLGFHPHAERARYTRHIGLVMGQKSLLLWDVPVIESLKLYRDIYEVAESDFQRRLSLYAEMLDLTELLQTPVRKLSLGQRMRAEFVAALLHDPRVIFLDEPTIGLDVVAKERIRQFLLALNRQQGTTILITTHDMRDVEALCSRVLLIEKGQLTYDGTVSQLKQIQASRTLHLTFSRVLDEARLKRMLDRWRLLSRHELGLSLEVPQEAILEAVQEAMVTLDLTDLTVEAPSLERIMHGVLERGYQHASA